MNALLTCIFHRDSNFGGPLIWQSNMDNQGYDEDIWRIVVSLSVAVLCASTRAIACQTENARHEQALRVIRHRRRQLASSLENDALVFLFLSLVRQQRVPRRCWMLPRMRHQWFLREVLATWDNDRWIENFRMTKSSFNKLCNLLLNKLEPDPRSVREPLPLEVRVGVALYNLGSTMENRVTANQFHCHKSTVSNYLPTHVRVRVNGIECIFALN